MLIINILLIILFFIILFYDLNLVEGQPSDDGLEGEEDVVMYNYSNLVTDIDTIISKINLSKWLGFDLKKSMEEYNIRDSCADVDKPIPEQFKNNLKPFMVEEDMKEINSEINIINSFLSPFKIEIKDDYDPFETNYRSDSETSFESSKLCSLVETIYNSNGVSASLVESITGKYGNCFIKTPDTGNDFINFCKESCYIQENKLETCNQLSSTGVTSCTDYMSDSNITKLPIHIQKNGLYYNCSSEYKQVGAEIQYVETPCIPKNNKCAEENIGFNKTCDQYNFPDEHAKRCEDYTMVDAGINYNCIPNYPTQRNVDEPANRCVRDVDNLNKPCYRGNYIDYESCKQKY